MILSIVIALPAALMGGCGVVVGVSSLFGPGGFWSGAPSIVFGAIFLAVFVGVAFLVKSLWEG